MKQNASGDLVINDGQMETVSGQEELTQCIRTIISNQLGDAPLAPELGMDYENLLGEDFNEAFAQSDFEDAILDQEPRVVAITDTEFSLDHKTRILSITLTMTVDMNQTENEDNYEEIEQEVTLDGGY
ncbi:putative baseplate assembly protein [Lactobacillus phage LBR48]|uniref:Putative baseplate assembly protein n=1 Tax=Lactobacillus phage LBR48 TaxID=755164 RepID=D6PSZ8_9CAUD|nr:putative baseplate assembly protein [Lactobacillus phage LBR48]ADF83489.1 putative baseplate assembly protein [Lactobacillus phage LBR48]